MFRTLIFYIFSATVLCANLYAENADFPICMYGVGNTAQISLLKKAGFNCFQSYIRNPDILSKLAKEAEKRNMKMVVYPYNVMKSTYSLKAKTWPILAWYLFDEPDVHKLSVKDLEQMNRDVKKWSPGHKTTFVIGQGMPSFKYSGVGDTLMIDWYPVPHLKLESVGREINLAMMGMKDAVSKKKRANCQPLWAVLQTFDWRDYPHQNPKGIGRFPTAYEIRFMTYLAILRGSSGIFYFTLSKPENFTLFHFPEQWLSLENSVSEIYKLKHVFEKGKEISVPFEFDLRLSAKAWKLGSQNYVVILNPTSKKIAMPEEMIKNFKWEVLFERKKHVIDLIPEKLNPYFKPYRVFVLEKKD